MANLFDVMSIDIVRDKVMKYTYPTDEDIALYREEHKRKTKELMILDVLNLYPMCTWCKLLGNMVRMQGMSLERKNNRRLNSLVLFSRFKRYYFVLRRYLKEHAKNGCNVGCNRSWTLSGLFI